MDVFDLIIVGSFGVIIIIFVFIGLSAVGWIPGTDAWHDRVYCTSHGMHYKYIQGQCAIDIPLVSGSTKSKEVDIPTKNGE